MNRVQPVAGSYSPGMPTPIVMTSAVEHHLADPCHVAHRDGREGAVPGQPGGRVDRGRPGGAVAAPEDVGADDEVPVRIERKTGRHVRGITAIYDGDATGGEDLSWTAALMTAPIAP